jgi:type IV pilus assembly protein PilE
MTLRQSSAGFTLIELMAVVAIVAVLLIVALPAYENQVIRGHRSAAKAEILEIADREQQFLLANRTYASKTTLEDNGFEVDDGVAEKYTYTIELSTIGVGLPRYTIEFTPIAGTVVAEDGPLSLTSEGVKEPEDKWGH